MSLQYVKYPATATGGVPIYANVAAFPATATTGSLAVDASTGNLYEFNGTTWVLIASQSAALSIGSPASGLALSSGVLTLALATSSTAGAVPNIGSALGVAPLDSGNKIPVAYLPSTVMLYLGAWNASTNTPTLADGTGVNGDTYRVNVAGTQNLGSGSQTFFVGDFVVYNGSIWQRSPAADGVISVNGLQGAVTLAQGNLTEATSSVLTFSGGTNAVWGSGTTIQVKQASASQGGYLSSTDWSTFNSKQAALTLGNLTDTGTDGITVTGGAGAIVGSGTSIAQHVADATHNGYLSSTDWSTFNGKQAAGSYLTALTGDGTASGPGSAALTLATVNSNTGSFGSSTAIPSFTVNAKGLITAASTNAVIAPAGTLSGTTLNSTVVSSSLTSVGAIGTGTWQGSTVAVLYGGTGVTTSTGSGNNVLSAAPALTGAVTMSGTLTVGGNSLFSGSTLDVQVNQNNLTQLSVTNTTSGSAAQAGITFGANSGGVYGYFVHSSASFSSSGLQQASTTSLLGYDTGGVIVGATHSGSSLSLASANTIRCTIDSNGNLISKYGRATPNYDTSSPSTGGTVTASANTPGLLITPSGTLATLTIKLPSSPIDGQQYWVASSQQLTAVTWQDSGGTSGNVIGGPATIGGTNRGARFVYSTGNTKWYNIG